MEKRQLNVFLVLFFENPEQPLPFWHPEAFQNLEGKAGIIRLNLSEIIEILNLRPGGLGPGGLEGFWASDSLFEIYKTS